MNCTELNSVDYINRNSFSSSLHFIEKIILNSHSKDNFLKKNLKEVCACVVYIQIKENTIKILNFNKSLNMQ